jgi:thiamine biosynthesis lipoprotein
MVLTDQGLELTRAPFDDADGVAFFQIDGVAMGTTCRVLFSAQSRAIAERLYSDISGWVQAFEARYSRFIETSLISRINTAGSEAVEIDDELISIFKLCDWFHWASRGLFDPTMLPLILLWDYQKECPTVPDPKALLAARELVDWKAVKREGTRVMLPREGMALDIGGIGKEYAVDRVIEMAQAAGLRHVMVDFGHDVRTLGSPPEGGPWRVGLEDPREPGRCWSGVGVSSMAIASSGTYARGFERHGKRYGHIIDPRTGYPVDNGCLSVSVVAPTCTEAGILATAALILGPDEFSHFLGASHQAEGCMVTSEKTFRTPGFIRYELSPETAR